MSLENSPATLVLLTPDARPFEHPPAPLLPIAPLPLGPAVAPTQSTAPGIADIPPLPVSPLPINRG